MKALVTGATGFVGRHLAHRLFASGHDVHVVVRNNSDTSSLTGYAITIHRVTNASLDLPAVLKAIQPDCVFHVAAYVVAEHRQEDIAKLVDSNITFSTELFDAMAQAGVTSLVNIGTSWQHYRDVNYEPVSLYAASKQAAEAMLAYYRSAFGLKDVTLKLFDTYGASDTRPKLMNLLKKASLTGVALKLSPGHQLLDLVYIDDVVSALVKASDLAIAAPPGSHRSYGVSSAQQISLRDLVASYESISGRRVPVEWGARPYRLREVMTPCTALESLPGWQPLVSLPEGISLICGFP